MFGKQKLLLIFPAIILIPILLGITPLNFIQKIGAGCPFSQSKQALKCNPCPFNSIVSQDEPTIVNLNLTRLDQKSTSVLGIQVLGANPIHFDITFNSIPLRC